MGGIRTRMKFQAIQNMAKAFGLPAYRVKKMDLIRSIQKAEGNVDCYGTERVNNCKEHACMWRPDCLALNGQGGI